jgi:exonuclease SbcC
MIPVSLTLKNFMSYGDEGQTLSFEGMHVACLSGDNGNGKSALLDAMTWALWGKTRASSVLSVTEDDLIRRTADEMEVHFEFELNAQKYRVVRKRRRGKTGDWQLAQALEEGQYVAIGGGGAREVGRQITQLLNMEYETFLASAYLQQGHADEFTRQKPGQRKQILSEILGLDQYDRLEAMARERARDLKGVMDELDGQIRILEAQAGRRQEYEAGLKVMHAAIEELEAAQDTQKAAAEQWREKRIRLEQVAQQQAEMMTAARNLQTELRNAEAARGKQGLRLRELNDMLAQRDAIVRDYQALVQARQRREQLEPEIQEFNRKSADLQTVSGAIDVERTRLEGEAKTFEQLATSAVRQAAEFDRLELQIKVIENELACEPDLVRDLGAAESELDQVRERFERLRASNRELTEALKELGEVLDLLQRPQAACPICESDLSGVKRDRVVTRQQAKEAELTAEQVRVQREGGLCKKSMETAQSLVRDLLARRDTLTARRSRLEEMTRTRETLACAAAELAAARAQAAAIRQQLKTEDFAHPKRLHKQRLEQEIERLRLVKSEYETVVARARNLADADLRHERLREAAQKLEPEREEMERREALVTSKQESLVQLQTCLDGLNHQVSGLDVLRSQTDRADAELARLTGELDQSRRREGALLGYLEDCNNAIRQCKDKEAERKRVHQEQWTYDRLAGCFGKKGIQALIIENAIPELEEEANDLLARMTDNGMQVRFLTTRAGKTTKSEIETLDISITDEAGPRPYELFSGGEAFRVNFAIRIALSRLLAHRSGARLQTLILDEGFGTQDGKGREKLVEAIEAIKGDFEKIIVITHVEELKDSFPQRIEVSKDGKGSKIYVF